MTIELAKVGFVNDMFVTVIPDGRILVLNKVDESLLLSGEMEETQIKALNIEIRSSDGTVLSCPSVIGLSNESISINTDHKEYEGEVLTPDNMEFCTIEIYD